MSSIEEAKLKIRKWREDPVSFVWDNFKVEPDEWQARGLRAFASPDPKLKRLALQACAGPGKTTELSWMGLNFISCYGQKGEHPKGAAISITSDNLKDNLWPEFAKWRARSAYLMDRFEWTKERIFAKEHAEDWFLSARSWPKTANAEEQGRTLSGLHSKFVLVLVDESGEIPIAVLRTAEQALSNCAFGKIVQAGNPTNQNGMLYAAATALSHLWHMIRVTGDPDRPDRSPRIPIDWAREQIKTYGRDNPWVMAYILGEFPPGSINALLSPDEVASAMGRHLNPDAYVWSQKRIGVDVARFGDDLTVLFPRQGLAAFKPTDMRNARTEEIVARLALAKAKFQSELEVIDGTGGFGAGVVDGFRVAGHNPVEYHASSKPDDPRFFNKRSEINWRMAQWVKRGAALPNVPGLQRQLTALTYYMDKGKFRVTEKDQMKKLLNGTSPDHSDALSETFVYEDMPASMSTLTGPRDYVPGQAVREFDPFRDPDVDHN